MMDELNNFIYSEIDNDDVDKERLINYLDLHEIVGDEVFEYCNSYYGDEELKPILRPLGYKPIPKKTFIKRIPFYFRKACEDVDNRQATLNNFIHRFEVESLLLPERAKKSKEEMIESVYTELEHAYYDLKISADSIFSYLVNQTEGYLKHVGDWFYYLRLCDLTGSTDFLPDDFLVAYNDVRIKAGLSPVIYRYSESLCDYNRKGNIFELKGNFPTRDRKPILEWTDLEIKDPVDITCTCTKMKEGVLSVVLGPNTTIGMIIEKNGEEKRVFSLYMGPQKMSFDPKAIKGKREYLNFSQEYVSDAIGVPVQVYQDWEEGKSIPDGNSILRIMNWLDINNVLSITA